MSQDPIFCSLILDRFKSSPCPTGCKSKSCPYSHGLVDFRRPFSASPYSKIMCPEAKACRKATCSKAHNITEQLYHPENYKKKYCLNAMKGKSCLYREFCAYVHSDMELKIVPLHLLRVDRSFLFFRFKSEFCPFKHEHDTFTCVYAHNWQDFKRPYFEGLVPTKCPQWSREGQINSYFEGCAAGLGCQFCHGWKELEYHPANFKVRKCENEKCFRRQICGFRHPEDLIAEEFDSEQFFVTRPSISYQSQSLLDYFDYVGVNEEDYVPDLFLVPKQLSSDFSRTTLIRMTNQFVKRLAPPADLDSSFEGLLDDFPLPQASCSLKAIQSSATVKKSAQVKAALASQQTIAKKKVPIEGLTP